MANVRITTNTTGTQPIIEISLVSNMANAMVIPFIQDVTITNSTGVYSYSTFSDVDMRKLSTPADNEISTNIVLDQETYFGNSSLANTTAGYFGLSQISIDKKQIYFTVYLNGNSAGAYTYDGTGFITSLAPTTSPDAPLWVSPLTVAVDGAMTVGTV